MDNTQQPSFGYDFTFAFCFSRLLVLTVKRRTNHPAAVCLNSLSPRTAAAMVILGRSLSPSPSANYIAAFILRPELNSPAVWVTTRVLTVIISSSGELPPALKVDKVFYCDQCLR
jgi:hypothetical protein